MVTVMLGNVEIELEYPEEGTIIANMINPSLIDQCRIGLVEIKVVSSSDSSVVLDIYDPNNPNVQFFNVVINDAASWKLSEHISKDTGFEDSELTYAYHDNMYHVFNGKTTINFNIDSDGSLLSASTIIENNPVISEAADSLSMSAYYKIYKLSFKIHGDYLFTYSPDKPINANFREFTELNEMDT